MLELLSFEVEGEDVQEGVEKFPSYKLLGDTVWRRNQGVLRPVCAVKGASSLGLRATVRCNGGGCLLRAVSGAPALTFGGYVARNPGQKTEIFLALEEGRLDDAVKVESLTLVWSFKPERSDEWADLARDSVTGPMTVYQIFSKQDMVTPYDRGLAAACSYVDSAPDPAVEICKGIARDLCYDAQGSIGGAVLDLFEEGRGDCNDHAALMEHLCRSIGLRADKLYAWGGTEDMMWKYRYRTREGAVQWPSLQLEAGREDQVPEDPHFQHHVVVDVGGRIFDPCYGTENYKVVEVAYGYWWIESWEGQPPEDESDWSCNC